MYLTQTIRNNAQKNKDGFATIMDDRKRTWGEFVERVARLAGGLTKLGVIRGDRVAILAANSDRYLEYYFACFWMGAVVVPMNLRWSAKENAYSLIDSGAKSLFIDDQFMPMAAAILTEATGVEHKIYMGDGDVPEGFEAYEDLIAGSQALADAGAGGEDLAGIFYTGGTTGFPKGVMLPHRGLWSSALAFSEAMRLNSSSIYLHSAPMYHLADGAYSLGTTVGGGAHAFIPFFTPANTIAAVEKYRATDLLLVPTMVKMVMDDPAFDMSRLSSLRQIAYGASPMPEGVIRQALEVFPGVGWIQAYGQTELSPLASFCTAEYHNFDDSNKGRVRSAGRAVICNEIMIVDKENNEVPRGEVGEVVVRGANTMLGYWNRPEETAKTLVDGWVHTGDGAWMDDEGFIFIADRLKDMIISGGENIFSAEVESAISKLPGVSEVAVVGIPSDEWGETVHAIVVPHGDASLDQQVVIDHCRALIAHYKCPTSVEIRTEPLPLSSVGKVLKKDLRAPFWEGRSRQVN